jgi:long-chain acyl-CoA synthetase
MQIYAWFHSVLEEWQDHVMANLPFFHVYAQAGVLPVSIVAHGPLVLVPNPRDLDDLLAAVQHTRAAYLPGVPTLFNALANHPRVRAGKANLHSLKLSVSGAAPLLAETKARFELLTGGVIVEGYAMTETMMAAIINPVQGLNKPGSIGLPLPDVEVQIVDLETGLQPQPPGALGELVLRAPQLMAGYWNQPGETAIALRDGWLYTGDIGTVDEDGYVFLVDRKKDLIKTSGFQVWPREIEEVLACHPAVKEVGVAGIPDEHQGEAVVAFVVLVAGATVTRMNCASTAARTWLAIKFPARSSFARSFQSRSSVKSYAASSSKS